MNGLNYLIGFAVGAAIGAHFGFEANGMFGAIGAGLMGGVLGTVAVALGITRLLNDAISEGDDDLINSHDHDDLPGRHD